jgi:hypothetical protein
MIEMEACVCGPAGWRYVEVLCHEAPTGEEAGKKFWKGEVARLRQAYGLVENVVIIRPRSPQ